jgi:hypothetical protein
MEKEVSAGQREQQPQDACDRRFKEEPGHVAGESTTEKYIEKRRETMKFRTIVTLALVLSFALGSVVMAASVEPTVIAGSDNLNKTCAVVMPGTYELKYDFDEAKWSDTGDGSLEVNYVKPSTLAGSVNSFDWTSNILVLGVIVKDGVDGANWYDYRAAGSMGDTYLTTPNDGAKNISHISWCYFPSQDYEELKVSKTAVTSYTREHFWDIDKSVDTENEYKLGDYAKIWLFIDGSGDETATWTVDVTYDDYEDSDWNVSGVITVTNTGTLDAVITSVEDVLAGQPISVNCGVTFPYTLLVDQALVCSYNEDGYVEGKNEVTVTTERDTYDAEAAIVWGDPTTEINKTVSVKDVSDLFGEVALGTVTAPNDAQFTYTKDFGWADYGADKCGPYQYDNTATIVETKQSASATLKVNVQCYVFDGETAWAANGDKPLELRYTKRGNWATYVKYEGAKTTTLFAGQTIDVGSVGFSAPVDGNVTITVELNDPWEFEDVLENLKVQDYKKAPSGNPEPGLFAHKKTCDAASSSCSIVVPVNNFYGVHVNVGQWIPDPNFGP